MKQQATNIPRVTRAKFLQQSPEPKADPVLVLTTVVGNHHFVISRPLLRKLAAPYEKVGREENQP